MVADKLYRFVLNATVENGNCDLSANLTDTEMTSFDNSNYVISVSSLGYLN